MNPRPREKLFADAALEGFEATCRVGHVRDQVSNEPGKNPAHLLAVPGLPAPDLGSRGLARADGEVCTPVEGREQALGIFDGCGEIRIREENALAPRRRKADLQRVSLAPVHRIAKQPNPWRQPDRRLANDCCRVIAAAVVDDDDLRAVTLRGEISGDLAERGSDSRELVEGGYDQRQQRRNRSHRSHDTRSPVGGLRRRGRGPRFQPWARPRVD